MKVAHFHFDEGLPPLLAGHRGESDLRYPFTGPQSLKHLVESLGIPHTEIGPVRANDRAVASNYQVQDGDDVTVVGFQPSPDPAIEPRFVLDGHLGRLASYVRMLGLDCLYESSADDEQLAEIAVSESRALVTRDRRLLMRKAITDGYLIRSLVPREQLAEVIARFQLRRWIKPFQRCIRCNHQLQPVRKEDVIDRLEPLTRRYFDDFRICPSCLQIYWKGSHFDRMMLMIAELG